MNRKRIESPFFLYKEKIGIPIELDEKRIATFFLLNKDLRTDFVYKTGGDQDITYPYYRRILEFFKKGK